MRLSIARQSRAPLAGNAGACVAAVLFGASVVATRLAVQEVPPLSLAVLRFGQGGLLLLFLLLVAARRFPHVERQDLPRLTLLGAVLFAIFPLTFNAGLRLTEASRGALMLATGPLWSAWLARSAKREHLRARQVGGIFLTVAGVGMALAERGLTWQVSGWAMAGDGLMLATAFWGAVYGVFAQPVLDRYPALTVTTYAMVLGTLLLLPVALAEGLPRTILRLDEETTALVLFLGIFGGALGYFLWTFALSRLTPTQVMVYVNLNPVVATVLGAAMLGEHLTGLFVAGFVAVVVGVFLVNWPVKLELSPATENLR